jgi:hypothetical protein
MSRLIATAVLLAAPLLTQTAAAQDCLCMVGDGFGLYEAETPDTTIASTVLDTHATPSADAAPAAPAHRTVLWCASANDPRCQPMAPTDVPMPRALSGGSVGATVASLTRVSRRPPTEMTMTPTFGLGSSTGIRSSLDRPPRG